MSQELTVPSIPLDLSGAPAASAARSAAGLPGGVAERAAYNLGWAAQAKESNQQLNALAYSISHDLRAPLRHVGGFAKLLSRSTSTVFSTNDRELVELIVTSANQMDRLIDALLQYSRLGSRALAVEEIDLNKLFEDAIRRFKPLTEERSLHWTLGPLPHVYGDTSMLTQAVGHLLENAVKFTGTRESAFIEIGCDAGSKDGIVVFVRDDGIGFDPKFAGKIYEVFQRLHAEGEYEGTGIGLALVRRIISRHGGLTWAAGKENEGATFYFSLPRLEPAGSPGGEQPDGSM